MQNYLNSIMENSMINIPEIRINNGYASRMIAEYEDVNKKSPDSKAKIRSHLMRTDRYLEKFINKFSPQGGELTLSPPNCRFIKTYSNQVTIKPTGHP